MAATVHEQAPVTLGIRHIESIGINDDEDMIAREVKSAVKKIVTNKLSTMVEESLDDILITLFNKVQNSNHSVVYNFFYQLLLDHLRKDVSN